MSKEKNNNTGVTVTRTTTVKLVIKGQEFEITEEEARKIRDDISSGLGIVDIDWKKQFERDLAARKAIREMDKPWTPIPPFQVPRPYEIWCGTPPPDLENTVCLTKEQ